MCVCVCVSITQYQHKQSKNGPGHSLSAAWDLSVRPLREVPLKTSRVQLELSLTNCASSSNYAYKTVRSRIINTRGKYRAFCGHTRFLTGSQGATPPTPPSTYSTLHTDRGPAVTGSDLSEQFMFRFKTEWDIYDSPL